MKIKLLVIVSVLFLSSCDVYTEFVSSDQTIYKQQNDKQVRLFLSEQTAPEYKEIGLIKIRIDFLYNLTEASKLAKIKALELGGNCIVYKQALSGGGQERYFIYEFIVGKLITGNR